MTKKTLSNFVIASCILNIIISALYFVRVVLEVASIAIKSIKDVTFIKFCENIFDAWMLRPNFIIFLMGTLIALAICISNNKEE